MSQEVPAPIVIEAGSAHTRVGIAGDLAPTVVLPSVYAKTSSGLRFGDDIYSDPSAELLTPIIDGIIHDWEPATQMWRHTLQNKLGMDPQDQGLALVNELWNPSENKVKALEHVFDDLQVPIFTLLPSPRCAAFESARTSAIVVNIGASTASVTPIIDGIVAHKAQMRSRFAGDFLTANILAACESKNIPMVPQYQVSAKQTNLGPDEPATLSLKPKGTDSFHTFQVAALANQMRGFILQVAPSVHQVPAAGAKAANVAGGGPRTFEFPSGYNVLFGSERIRIAEPLFKPNTSELTLPEGSLGISDLVYQALNKVDASPETMSGLLSNVILCGGTSLLTGFARRLENDMATLLPNYTCKYHIPQDQEERTNLVWTGASVLGSIGTYDKTWVTKQEYEEIGAEQLVEKRFK